MDQTTMIAGGIALIAFGAIAGLVLMPGRKEKAAKRVAQLSTNGRSGKAVKNSNGKQEIPKDRRKQVQESLNKIDEKAKEAKERKKLSLSQRIEQSGLEISERDFYLLCAICAAVMAAIGLISGQKLHIVGLMSIVGGLGIPRWLLAFLRGRRQKKFVTEFANSIEVIVRGVKSGLPVNECLKIIARDAQEPVRTEFYLMTEGLRIGLSLEQALNRMYDRMPISEVNFFSIVLIIQQQTGGNLAEALGNLATVLRNRKMMEGKIDALSMEAKASAVILGALPIIVTLLINASSPDYLRPLFEEKMGNLILMAAGVWMAIGIFIMKKMISIKV
ncbi:MAG: type II secretion system F family protein [bacterium]